MKNRNLSDRFLSIRTKILLVVVASIIALSVTAYLISALILLPSYLSIEREGVERDVNRATDAIGEFSDSQMIKLADWASWDQAYEYGFTHDRAWTDENIYATGMANLDINILTVADTKGEVFYLQQVDIDAREEVGSTSVASYLASHADLLTHPDAGSETRGLVMLPEGPMILVSLPMLPAEGVGETSGSISFGRFLDARKIAELGDITHLSLSVYRYDDETIPATVARAKARLLGGASTVVEAESPERIAGYALLRDVYGAPALILVVKEDRPIFVQGNITFLTFLGVGAFALLVFGIVIVLLLEQIVISRFVRLTKDVETINENRDLSRKVEGGTGDEIGRLADRINRLLQWLLEARDAEASTRREMVNVMNELKRDKEQMDEMQKILKGK
jgi:sensor domain CHASE-containing protein